MKTQICTTIEQSKKLLALGLSPDSADMHYNIYGSLQASNYERGVSDAKLLASKSQWDTDKTIDKVVPAWSLSALLNILSRRIEIGDTAYALCVSLESIYYWNVNNGNLLLEVKVKDSLVDACYEMIMHLHELNLL